MSARWLSNNQPNITSHATLSGSLNSGIVARVSLATTGTVDIASTGKTRLATDLTILSGVERGLRGECGFAPVVGNLPLNNAPDYPKQRQRQSHFRERCLSQ